MLQGAVFGRDFVRKSLPSLFVKSAKSDWIAEKLGISGDYNMGKSIFEQMGGAYHKHGDYSLPALAVPENEKPSIGVWAQRHLQYIREHHRGLYVGLQLSGKLGSYLADIDHQAEDMFLRLVDQTARREGVTESLTAEGQMAWVV